MPDDLQTGLQTCAKLQIYRLVRHTGGDACSHYNALLSKLVSFEPALDRRLKYGWNLET